MIGRALFCLLLALSWTEARVDYANSYIYDEFDFQGQSAVIIDAMCASACRIYASITPESKKLATNLLIQLPKGFTSVADVAGRVDALTGQKGYLEVKATPSLSIVNGNSQQAAGPLVLYVVKSDAASPSNEIWEAEGFSKPAAPLPVSLTVMSARPFTLKQAAAEEANQEVTVYMTGFDGLHNGECKYLYHEIENSAGFSFEVNGPILTVAWSSREGKPMGSEISASIGISNTQHVARSGWVGSPGFHGCLDKEPYRSSLYDFHSHFHAEITSEDFYIIYDTIETNTGLLHPLNFTDPSTHIKYPISNSPSDNPITLYMRIKDLAIDWQPEPTRFFMARWNSSL